jgi:hypothetical protein
MFVYLIAVAAFTAPVPAMTNDWFSPVYDFPTSLKPNELLVVEAEITVNPHGYMQSCTGHVFSGNPAMGPYVCSRLRLRNVFEPARDSDKSRIYGVYRNFIILFNGRDTKQLPTQYRSSDFNVAIPSGSKAPKHGFFIQFAVDTQGRPSNCSLVAEAGFGLNKHRQSVDPAIVERACSDVPSKLRTAPARDGSGSAVRSVQNALIGVIEVK